MSAEAQRQCDEPLATEAWPVPQPDRGTRSPGAERRRRPRQEAPCWNVLTEELVSFPRPGRHVGLEELTGVRAPAREDSGDDAALARRYGEEWLQRELRTIRYLADGGYPALPRRSSAEEATCLTIGWTAGSSALAVPAPADDNIPVVPDRSAPSRRRRRSGESTRPVPRPRPVPRRFLDDSLATGSLAAAKSARGLRRLLPGVATLAALVGIWAGAGALSATHDHPLAVLPGSTKVAGGYTYVVRPGDTLWTIAGRLDPGGDPRPLVTRLESELHGRVLMPGMRLFVP